MPIVTHAGFQPDEISPDAFLTFAALESGAGPADGPVAVALPNDFEAALLTGWLDRIDVIAIAFPNFADGRGFSLARRLRRLGFQGRLRAAGRLIADQHAMARACGFDEIAIDDDRAARQPEAHWRAALAANDALPAQAIRARAAR